MGGYVRTLLYIVLWYSYSGMISLGTYRGMDITVLIKRYLCWSPPLQLHTYHRDPLKMPINNELRKVSIIDSTYSNLLLAADVVCVCVRDYENRQETCRTRIEVQPT